MSKQKNLNIRIDEDLRDAFKEKAVANGTNATQLLTEFMQSYVNGTAMTTPSDGNDTAMTEEDEESPLPEADIEAIVEEKMQSYQANFNAALEGIYRQIETINTQVEKSLAVQHTYFKENLRTYRQEHQWGIDSMNKKFNKEFLEVRSRLSHLETQIKVESPTEPGSNSSTETPDDGYPIVPDSLTQTQLGKRLGKAGSTLNDWRKKPDFADRVREIDPDGIAWEWDGKKYVPLM